MQQTNARNAHAGAVTRQERAGGGRHAAKANRSPHRVANDHRADLGIERLGRPLDSQVDHQVLLLLLAQRHEPFGQLVNRPVVRRHRLGPFRRRGG